MAFLSFNEIGISHISACVPKSKFRNADLSYLIPDSDVLERLVNTIGIKEKRHASDETTTSDLCYEAAMEIFASGNISKDEIDGVIFLSMSPDYITPPTSVILQERLGLSKEVYAIDLNMPCSGFVYALSTAFGLIAGGLNNVLVLVGETMTKFANPHDRVNFPLYGDAGTASIVTRHRSFGNSTFYFSSDGAGANDVIIPNGGFRNQLTAESLVPKKDNEGNIRRAVDISMNGINTFNHAVFSIPKQIKTLMNYLGISGDDIDYLIPHQANKFMLDFIVKKLKFDKSKVPMSLDRYGNTSCATIPLTIVSELKGLSGSASSNLFLTSIGAGWSFGSAYLKETHFTIYKIVEL